MFLSGCAFPFKNLQITEISRTSDFPFALILPSPFPHNIFLPCTYYDPESFTNRPSSTRVYPQSSIQELQPFSKPVREHDEGTHISQGWRKQFSISGSQGLTTDKQT
ncbi:unnamed protein product [Eretmochelys imbricata]